MKKINCLKCGGEIIDGCCSVCGSIITPQKLQAKVVPIGTITKLDVPPDYILKAAEGQLEGVLLLGWDKNGDIYTASSYADGGTILWLMELCKKMLLQSVEIEEL
jgi:hypothetical protein